MAIKEKDFIEIEYTGKLKEEGMIFDTTDKAVAEKEDIYNDKANYGPVVICVGEHQILKGLEDNLVGKEPGEYEFDIKTEDAFGKKSTKLIQLVPLRVFKEQNIVPQPGLQVNIDGAMGVIRIASGGRVVVDFNHPLASKDVNYKVKITKIITDDVEKIRSVLSLEFRLKDEGIEINEKKASVTLKSKLPKEAEKVIIDKIKELLGLDIEFKIKEDKVKEAPKEEKEEEKKE